MNTRSLLLAFGVALLSQSAALATTIKFNNTEVPGITGGAAVANQWQSFGIIVTNAHWYDNAVSGTIPDPFAGTDPFDGMGVANTTRTAEIMFVSPIDSLTVQWAKNVDSDSIEMFLFDSSHIQLHDLDFQSGGNSDTTPFTHSDIQFLQWRDNGSEVAISTLTFPTLPVNNAPEPGSLGLVGLALVGLAVIGRRRAASSTIAAQRRV